MTSIKKTALASLCALAALTAVPPNAYAYLITMSTANQGGVPFLANSAAAGFNSVSAIEASFQYSGPLSFNDTTTQNNSNSGDLNSLFFTAADISGYSLVSLASTLDGPAGANFTSSDTFLASSGSASGYQYGSFITINLGALAAGTVLTITHDDGASVYQNGLMVGTTIVEPTTAVTETVVLTSTTGLDTMLYYARENGTPSILDVEIPEPASVALLGVGIIGTGVKARRRRQSTTTPTAG